MSKDEHLIRPMAVAHRRSILPIHRPISEGHTDNDSYRFGTHEEV